MLCHAISERLNGLALAVRLLTDIRTAQELLDHKDVQTTMIHTHVLNRGGRGVRSPVDAQRL
jgi:integrase